MSEELCQEHLHRDYTLKSDCAPCLRADLSREREKVAAMSTERDTFEKAVQGHAERIVHLLKEVEELNSRLKNETDRRIYAEQTPEWSKWRKAEARAESAERTVKAMGAVVEAAKKWAQAIDSSRRQWNPTPIQAAGKEIFAALADLASLAPSPCEGIKNGLRCSSCVAANKPCRPEAEPAKPMSKERCCPAWPVHHVPKCPQGE